MWVLEAISTNLAEFKKQGHLTTYKKKSKRPQMKKND